MVKGFRIPALALLASAFVLQFLASISLPYLTKLDVTRTHFSAEAAKLLGFGEAMTEVRVCVFLYRVSLPYSFRHPVWCLVSYPKQYAVNIGTYYVQGSLQICSQRRPHMQQEW